MIPVRPPFYAVEHVAAVGAPGVHRFRQRWSWQWSQFLFCASFVLFVPLWWILLPIAHHRDNEYTKGRQINFKTMTLPLELPRWTKPHAPR